MSRTSLEDVQGLLLPKRQTATEKISLVKCKLTVLYKLSCSVLDILVIFILYYVSVTLIWSFRTKINIFSRIETNLACAGLNSAHVGI